MSTKAQRLNVAVWKLSNRKCSHTCGRNCTTRPQVRDTMVMPNVPSISMPTSSVASPVANTTPMMEQYQRLKDKAGDALLFFRMGDFYELFQDDAVVASRAPNIALTARDSSDED